GYDVAWKAGADQYTVWSTDSSGNYLSNLIGVVSGTTTALESIETTFNQDLNGDGVVGLTTTVIKASGSASLDEVGNNYYLYTSGTGPELKYNGAAVSVGEFGGWAPIAMVQTATGYEVAWKVAGADQYTVWNTDSSGNYVSNAIGVVSGTTTTFESFENVFHQDLNGDGVVGLTTTVIKASGSASLDEVGNNYYLYTSGTGPELKYNGAVVTAGEFGGWAPIAMVQTATGYEVAWKVAGADQYTVWNTDSSGNYVSNAIGVVSGTTTAFESFENVFHQDLNGDGVVGLTTTVIKATGSASLDEVGNNYYLYTGGTGPELKYNGAAVTAGEFGGWAPTAMVQTATGYEVAWKVAGADQYTVWNTDSSGNYVSNAIGVVSGTTTTFESFENVFHQDLNGDGVVGLTTTVIKASGSASLDEVGNNYYLYTSGTGPELKYNGAVVTAGEFGGWAPIAMVQTATGYEVAWKVAGADQYTVWNTDSSGNYVSNAIGVVSGTTTTFESFENVFHQDLNGDGVVGLTTTVIKASGSASLDEVGNNYYLYTSGTGPELKYNGAVVTAGEFGGWAPIAMVQTATGYEVAWKVAGADQYTVWNTDSSGNYVSNAIGVVSGTTTTFESFENVFHQDLNGDGVVGLTTTVIKASGSASLDEVGNNYYLYTSGTGPELKYNGAVVTAGEFGGWAPIAMVQTTTGYEVAWKVAGADQYTVWNTDSSGNYVSNAIGVVSGTTTTFESFENVFHQDLNGDGVVGLTTTVIKASGSASLDEVGNNYYLYTSGTGPELKYNGAVVTAGEFGGWAPIAMVQTATGYEVAWKVAGADQYTVWNTDSSGNYVSNAIGVVSGTTTAFESFENVFHQDLNGDGVVGLTTTVIKATGSASLDEVGNNYYLYTGGTGPELKYNGAAVTAGEFGGWAPTAMVQTATGYEVAWKVAGADQYTVWNTDSSGNYVSNAIGVVSGTTTTFESFENVFHQDLNGDGVVGLTTTVIKASGSASLDEVGNNYYLYTSGTGPELKYNGAVVTAGEFGGWAPIAMVQTATGYEVAWKVAGADQYTVWNTDSSGNYVSNAIGVVSGTTTTFESFENVFHQDLNGDGVVGLTTTVIKASGSASLDEVGNNYYLYTSGTGPELKYNGAVVTAGEFGGWAPIAMVQTATGYEVAWKVAGADQYTVWNTDSSGNYVSNAIGVVSGTTTTFESFENVFHQDLNGDGVVGLTTTVIKASGSASLDEVGNNYYLYTSGTGPELKYNGAVVTAGEFGGWAPIAMVQTTTGYEVAWKVAGADQYTVWNTDSSGNYVSNAIGVVSGTTTTFESFENVFHQDLNGDGVVGLTTTVIKASGSASLDEVGNNYYLYTSGTGPELKYNGAVVTAGEFGGWAPIAMVQTTTGYEVAWKVAGADQYTVWNTDSSGNYVSNAIGVVSGTTTTFESFENVFHQDLNGDGVVGLTTTVIKASGSASLDEVGNNYYLYTSGTGPELKYNGAVVTAGEFGGWAPIAMVQTATGYEVAWKVAGADQYTVWNTDSSGNYVSNAIGVVSGTTTTFESFENVFQQDLNGDGVVGLTTTVIKASGSTSLDEVGNNYYLYTSGTGPELKYNGAVVTAGEFGGWAPIAMVQTATGYEVAWKVAGADQYTVWNTDSSGNYVSNAIGVVSGTTTAFESFENVFHQDLNGDGVVGLTTTVIKATGSASLDEVGNNYYLYTGGTGPELKYNGAAVTAGEFGGWAPTAMVQTATGYEVAWKVAGADQYTVWNTDSSGNYVSNAIGVVSGTTTTFESFENVFHQDLNGDGVVGLTTTVIKASGSASLDEVGNNYYLYTSGTGPELKYNGAVVTAGEFGGWAPIAMVQTATGYEVAWKVAGADQYTVWNTDSSGNYVSNAIGVVSGTTTTFESFENVFHQDLNGDGVVGLTTTVIKASGSASLDEVGNNYYLYTSGTGPELKYNGAVVTAGEFGGWAPIAMVQTATGYEVAWKVAGADQYTVWNTDSSGNYVSNAIGVVSGTTTTFESFENVFHQDLNGDGVVGLTTTVIKASGSASLDEVGNNYYLYTSGTGPELKYNGAVVTAGEFGGWAPIAMVQTTTGYEVAWKVAGADQYTVWNTDSSGNYVSNAIGVVSGTTTTFESFENVFHQDLNGDGVVGLTTTVIKASGSASLDEVGNNYYLYTSGTGPELKYNGAVVTAGEFGGWAPIAMVQTTTGYEVAWKVAGADQYTVWNTDSSGNYVSNAIGVVSGTTTTFESFENVFHQDLNGDGVVGLTTTVIKASGSASLDEVGNNYYLYTSGTGPELKYNGAVVTAGEFGGWAPIAMVQTATGYEVAWKVAGADQYTVWNTDSSGNYVSNAIGVVSGTTTTFESFENVFQQDLNGDGVVGLTTTVIKASGSTSLDEVGNNYYLYTSGTGPELKYNGAVVTAGEFGGWAPIAMVQTATGYEVAWKVAGADQYTVWNTDSSGNYVSNAIGVVSGTTTAFESFENVFHQDLNGDGVVGLTTTVIKATGSASLDEVGNNYYLYTGGTGPELKYNGAAVTAGEFGGWAPTAMVQTATGYEVAWKVAGADQYTVWNTDSSGNYVSNAIGVVSGTTTTFESFENVFHQDLNGDGVVGLTTTVIKASGSASLDEVGNNYYLYTSGTGPELKYNGAVVTAGEFGGWAPIAMVQTATGYEVAWKVAGADQYTVWNTDSSGNYVSNAIGVVSGTTTTFESFENVFHQDLNGDGVVGLTTTVIKASGSASLDEVGNNYYLYTSGTGPELKYNGAVVTAGEFGGWAPIAMVQTATGYEVAWKVAGADQYTVWNTDSSGNYVSNAIGVVSGTTTTFESFENVFHQDLNGDGVVGLTTTVIKASGSASLDEVGNNYYLYTSGTGPELKYNGAVVTAGEFGGWAPIAMVQTTTGYEVAWKVAGADQYTVWNTDSSGNYVSNAIGVVSGTTTTFESFENVFHQDLNGDGVVGLTTTVIKASGSASLDEVGNNYYLYTSGTGPELKYNGAVVTAGEFGGWAPIAMVQTTTGYEVAWKVAGADQYTVWNTDSSGNYVSNAIGVVSGTTTTFESFENVFHQDLNGDGVVGLTTTVIKASGSASLDEVGNNYYLYTSGTGPELKYNGAVVTAGEFGGWAPIAMVQTATGYEVAWKVAGADQYTVWNTDSSGNYVSNAIGVVSGTTTTFESFENVFQQDLNGDGVVGLTTTVIKASGSTSLDEVGNNYYLYTSGTGPELKYNGAVVTAGEFGGWAPIAMVQTATGYEVAWKVAGADQYTVWNTDSSGNYVSNAIGVVSGTTTAFESFENVFHQDLNGDGVVGLTTTVIKATGSASLDEVGNNYYLYTGGTGPELKYNGAAVTAGEFGGWAPTAMVQTATGYEVAWKVAGADQYTVWNTDSSGNYVSNAIGVVSGTTTTFESFENVFHQDLNGDGVVGLTTTVIKASGSASLDEVGNNYYLYTSGTGPELKYNGAVVTAGEFGGWAPIAMVQTTTGYEVAWKVAGADQYTVWNTDSSGNYVSNAIGVVSGTTTTFESFENVFHQDLNGDGVVGLTTTVIKASGSASLDEVGNNYYLYTSGTGPELKYNGAVVTAGEFGGWAPIAMVQTATGYEVAWKVAGADQYTVWNTDSSGNYVSNAIGVVSGTTTTFESFENVFHQDLNGDGVVGLTTTVIKASGSASLDEVGNNYYLYTSGTGPELKYNGAVVTAGEFGGWAPIAMVQTTTGYEVAWKVAGADQYTVWNTDSSGNYVSNAIGVVSGTTTTFESFENVFHQDLNGDGVVGLTTTVIKASGSASLDEVGNNYYLYTSGTGPELKYNGAVVTAGEFGGWAPIAMVQTATGYEVAWKVAGADQYTVWNTDSSGNYVSNAIGVVSGTTTTFESFENVFHQDLNGDGVVGLTTTVIKASGSASLDEVGNNYYLYTSGTGPELKYNGAVVTAGEFGGWAPIAMVQTATGYEVAWKVAGADQYTVWNTDGSGNYVSSAIGVVSGTTTTFESFENVFHQDLNGDGVVGLTTTAIKASGSTSLDEVGNNYYLYTSGTGPELKYNGAAVTVGEFGGWAPIAMVQTATGYEVAWKVAGADQYTVWNTDSSGNYVSNAIGVVSGTTTTFESFENVFHQDLNGDGVVGLTTTVIKASGSASLD